MGVKKIGGEKNGGTKKIRVEKKNRRWKKIGVQTKIGGDQKNGGKNWGWKKMDIQKKIGVKKLG